MLLLKSTSDMKIDGHSYAGFPLLVSQEGYLLEEAIDFLIFYCVKRGRVSSKTSWMVFGQHLYHFFSFCEANSKNWWEIDAQVENEMLLAVYRDVSIEQFKLSVTTVNQRLRTVIQFYKYAQYRGWIDNLPYGIETVKSSGRHGFLAHTERSGSEVTSYDVMAKTSKKKLKFLSVKQVKELLGNIKNPTLKLMVRLCLQTGIRKSELLTFPLILIKKPDYTKSVIKVPLNPNVMTIKGDKERTIDIPTNLMADLWRYVNELRHQQIQDSEIDSIRLFLTSKGEEWSEDSRAFNNALKRLDLEFDIHPHILRHTYATHTLAGLQQIKTKRFEPLIYLRDRLGHSSISTTEVYLHLINELMEDLTTVYQDEIDAIC